MTDGCFNYKPDVNSFIVTLNLIINIFNTFSQGLMFTNSRNIFLLQLVSHQDQESVADVTGTFLRDKSFNSMSRK